VRRSSVALDKEALDSTHGSLSEADAAVPLGFAYPGATSPEPKHGLDMPMERRAMESALGLAPCKNSDASGCATLPPP
jgi:hypothetical protein